PTLKVAPRRMTRYPDTAVITRCRAKATPAVIRPKAVATCLGSLNQIDSTPPNNATAPTIEMTWRTQKARRFGAASKASHRKPRPSAVRPITHPSVRPSLMAFSGVAPIRVTPNRRRAVEDVAGTILSPNAHRAAALHRADAH